MTHDLDKATSLYLMRMSRCYNPPGKATISYLILPAHFSKRYTEPDEEAMDFGGDFMWNIGTSTLVDKSSLKITDSQKKCFARAMKVLQLDVFVHPSQLEDRVSAYSPSQGFRGGDPPKKDAGLSTPFVIANSDSRTKRKIKGEYAC